MISMLPLKKNRIARRGNDLGQAVLMAVCVFSPWLAMAAEGNAQEPGGKASRYALIYDGPGSAEDAPEAVALVTRQAGLPIRYVSRVCDIPKFLPGAALLAIGGTEDNLEPLRKQFTPEVVSDIQIYLRKGGRFVGFCGGGYLASQGYEDDDGIVKGLGIIPATTDAFLEDMEARVISVRWKGANRQLYYQAGPKFILNGARDGVEVIATYRDGSIAVLLCAYGKGKVLVSGPHPEAPDSWRNDIPEGAADWKACPELASGLIQNLLSDRAIGIKE